MALLQGITNFFSKPQPSSDNTPTPNATRTGKYNELAVNPYYVDQYPIALEGSYFIASSPTPGTGIAITTSLTAYASGSVNPFIFILNQNAAGGPNIELDYLKLIQTAGQLPTTGTNEQIAVVVDNQAGLAAISGGSLITPVNVNPLSVQPTGALIRAGALTAAADTGAVRLLFQDYIEPITTATPCAVAGDEFYVKFGSLDHNSGTSATGQVSAGTPLQVKMISASGPPVIVTPGWAAKVKIFGAANAAAATYSFEMGYRER